MASRITVDLYVRDGETADAVIKDLLQDRRILAGSVKLPPMPFGKNSDLHWVRNEQGEIID